MNDTNNQNHNKIADLYKEIYLTKAKQTKNATKEENLRKYIVRNLLISLTAFILGAFTYRPLSFAAIVLSCLTTVIGGIITLYYQNKNDKFDKKINKLYIQIEKHENLIEKIPTKENPKTKTIISKIKQLLPAKSNTAQRNK